MKEQFQGEVFAGHKGDAVEVPFDPSKQWEISPQKLQRGRHGHFVEGVVNGIRFESTIVPRMKKFFLLIDEDTKTAAKIVTGDKVTFAIGPLAAPPKS